jgi:hypothetical protein
MKRAVSTFLQILEITGVCQLDCCHHAQHCINTNVKSIHNVSEHVYSRWWALWH